MVLKNLLKNKNFFVSIFFIIVFLAFFCCHEASAATLNINSDAVNLKVGDTSTLYVMLNSGGVAINNAEATIKFSTDLVEIISISRGGSIFNLWVEEPYFSNINGLITFNGGLPNPGFTGSQGLLLSMVVKAKKAGQADFIFSSSAVRANDGLGTNVLNGQQGKTLIISAKNEATAKQEEPPIKKQETEKNILIDSAPLLSISSPTHPGQNLWYQNKNALFRWVVPAGIDALQTSISNNASSVPQTTYSPAIREKSIKNLADGIWYFKIRGRKNGSWGPVSSYVVRIDTDPPKNIKVEYNYDDKIGFLNIKADIQDKTSGIDYYELYINDSLIEKIAAEKLVNGNYGLAVKAILGDNTVKFLAVDKAGNKIEVPGTFYASEILDIQEEDQRKTSLISTIQIDQLPQIIADQEQLLIRGKFSEVNKKLAVNLKKENEQPIVLETIANFDGAFFVLTPKLKSGSYDIWAESVGEENLYSSNHLLLKVKKPNLSIIAIYHLIMLVIVIMIFLFIMFFYYLRHPYRGNLDKQKIKMVLGKSYDSEMLILLKSRLEKQLAILQTIRHNRILTKDEKKIRQELENDLDVIDQELQNLKQEGK